MTKTQGSLDVNVILRLLVNDVPEQYLAAKKLLTNAKDQLAVSDTALIEVAFVLHRAYGLTRPEVKEAIEGFMTFSQINCNRILFDQALEIYLAHPSLSLEDCAIATYAKLNNALPLYTFDQKLAKISKDIKLL